MVNELVYLGAGLAVTESTGITDIVGGGSDSDGVVVRDSGDGEIQGALAQMQARLEGLSQSQGGQSEQIGNLFSGMQSQLDALAQNQANQGDGNYGELGEIFGNMQNLYERQGQITDTINDITDIVNNPGQSSEDVTQGVTDATEMDETIEWFKNQFQGQGQNTGSEDTTSSEDNLSEGKGWFYQTGYNVAQTPGALSSGILDGVESIMGDGIYSRYIKGIGNNDGNGGGFNILNPEYKAELEQMQDDIQEKQAKQERTAEYNRTKVTVPGLGDFNAGVAESIKSGDTDIKKVIKNRTNPDLKTRDEILNEDPFSDYDPFSLGG